MKLTLDQWADVASIAAAFIAIGALVYTAAQVHANTSATRAQFWLELRKMFAEHQEVHLKLRNQEWSTTLPTNEDLAKLEAYMGLFEHCEMMLKERLLDWSTFKAIYGYRLNNLLDDQLIIREKLIDRRNGWLVFVELLQRMTDLEKRRYLSGFWDIDTNKWKLWWGFAELEEGVTFFKSFDELKNGYEAKLAALKTREHGVTHAWLMSKTKIEHQWPSR